MLKVNWKGGMAFEAAPPSGVVFVMDATPEAGGAGHGPSPLETLCASVAACSAMDVISILQKKKQVVTSYRIEVEWTRGPEGQWPRPIRSMVVRHVVSGEGLDPAAVARSVELSDTKYCSVISTLRESPAIVSEWRIEEP
jgi:putative redox protein